VILASAKHDARKIKNPRPSWNGGRPASDLDQKHQAASVDYDYANNQRYGQINHRGGH
jgi:hypothetical protein